MAGNEEYARVSQRQAIGWVNHFLSSGVFNIECFNLTAPQIVLMPGVNNALCHLLPLISLASCLFMTLTRE
jgi:hypothetical protein